MGKVFSSMFKNITLFFTVFILCITFASPVCASEAKQYVVDEADLLTESEEAGLQSRLSGLSMEQELDVVVVTVNTLNGLSPAAYSDNYYDYYDYGYGDDKSGILLLVSIDSRDYYMSTYGKGITIFTDAGIDYIGGKMVNSLSDGNYAKAFDIFADQCDKFTEHVNAGGEPYDTGNMPRKPLPLKWIFISIVVGIVIAVIYISVLIAQLKTVRMQKAADSYVKPGSMHLTESRDLYLYSIVNRVKKPDNNGGKSSGNRSYGSSTHRSSSGRIHGGGGGKF